jgi:hypothetical protein
MAEGSDEDHPHFHDRSLRVCRVSTWWISTSDHYDPATTYPLPAGSFATDLQTRCIGTEPRMKISVLLVTGLGPMETVTVPERVQPRSRVGYRLRTLVASAAGRKHARIDLPASTRECPAPVRWLPPWRCVRLTLGAQNKAVPDIWGVWMGMAGVTDGDPRFRNSAYPAALGFHRNGVRPNPNASPVRSRQASAIPGRPSP